MRNILNVNNKQFCSEFNIKSNKSITKTDNILDTVLTLSENYINGTMYETKIT